MKLRDYRSEDAAAVDRVVRAAYAELSASVPHWEQMSKALGQLVAGAAASEVLVAEDDDGQIVGAVGYVGPNRPKRSFFEPKWPVVRLLAVAPAHRGRNVGEALMQECIARARRDGASLIALHTSPVMHRAQRLYKRLGFTLLRELPPLYGVPYGLYVKTLS